MAHRARAGAGLLQPADRLPCLDTRGLEPVQLAHHHARHRHPRPVARGCRVRAPPPAARGLQGRAARACSSSLEAIELTAGGLAESRRNPGRWARCFGWARLPRGRGARPDRVTSAPAFSLALALDERRTRPRPRRTAARWRPAARPPCRALRHEDDDDDDDNQTRRDQTRPDQTHSHGGSAQLRI